MASHHLDRAVATFALVFTLLTCGYAGQPGGCGTSTYCNAHRGCGGASGSCQFKVSQVPGAPGQPPIAMLTAYDGLTVIGTSADPYICIFPGASVGFFMDNNVYPSAQFSVSFGPDNPFGKFARVFTGANVVGVTPTGATPVTGSAGSCSVYTIFQQDLKSANGLATADPKVVVGGSGVDDDERSKHQDHDKEKDDHNSNKSNINQQH